MKIPIPYVIDLIIKSADTLPIRIWADVGQHARLASKTSGSCCKTSVIAHFPNVEPYAKRAEVHKLFQVRLEEKRKLQELK